ncbi:MAG: VWA domain-containing protein [Hyphomonadaceae bacterium]|nr:VWA domain-containing protein [Hyphomonadaceae bacterium]
MSSFNLGEIAAASLRLRREEDQAGTDPTDTAFKLRVLLGAVVAAAVAALAACGLVTSTNRSVFILFDVSGSYAKNAPASVKLANLMIADLQPGDWLAASQISTCSFSEKEIILQRQLPETPSLASSTKRELFAQLTAYAGQVKSSGYTDIHGALAQAAFELRQRPEKARYIVMFSDMIEDYSKKCDTSKVELDLTGIHVVATNVVKSNPSDPEAYFARLNRWEKIVTDAGGIWQLVVSPDQLPKIVTLS